MDTTNYKYNFSGYYIDDKIIEDLVDLIYERACGVYGLINIEVSSKIKTRTFPERTYEYNIR